MKVIALASLLSLLASIAQAITVTDLRCEYLVDPLGIDTPEPRLSWRIEDPEQARDQRQTASQVIVEDGVSGKILWDSGRTESGQSVHVAYAGRPLVSSQDCRWKVRVWDKDGEPSGWSEPARFVMGLLDPADWTGDWIRFREAQDIDHLWHRKTFDLAKVPEAAFCHLASIGYHELYVNGKRVDDRVLAPSLTNLTKRVFYVTYDIRPFLRPGGNVIAVWTGSGWARADGSYGKGVWEQDSVIRCQVHLSDGTDMHSDESWKCAISPMKYRGKWNGGGLGEYGGEVFDARLAVEGWNLPEFDDSGWAPASAWRMDALEAVRPQMRQAMTRKLERLELSAHLVEPDRKVERLAPVTMDHDPENDRTTFDFGVNFTGWLEFDLREGEEGQRVTFRTANQPGMIEEFDQVSVYIHDETGTGTFSHKFNYMAGRWVTVEGLGYEPKPEDIRCFIVTNDRARTGRFESSSDLFNRIYEADLRTYIANTVNGVTMDCPHRERYGYGEIALACSWGCAIPNYESAAYYRKAAQDWFDVQREDGFVNTIAPQVYKGAGGTLWSSAPVTLSWEFHRAYGDQAQLAHAYGPMKKWVDYLHGFVSDEGVLTAYESASRFLGDWATPHGSEYGNTEAAKLFNNCVYAYCLQVMAESAAILGRESEAAIYQKQLGDLRRSVHRKFYNEETGVYIDGRQLALAFPLYVGVTPEPLREKVMERFVEEITVTKPYLDTGSSGLPILLKFIVEHAGRTDLLFHCLQSTEHPGYGYFLRRGETTWPEYWQVDDIPSRIHTCYTGIAGWFMRGVGGIRPDPAEWGMKRFVIKPQLVGDLEWVKCSSASLYGTIRSEWKREGTTTTFDIEVPPNTTATVFIPSEKAEDVCEAKGLRPVRHEGGCAVFEVGAGAYRFVSKR
ncbi:family 78 glycoside hydrolase catalytic domain [Haloferula sp. A504]|uniref:family 78 glycoside hydrolase catalytic domain n=1 Tax=Haloferula sp. A504 TaxID=3373601 RepID=UPI0031C6CCEC|nr:glycoside hydrolase family 78 protein [Verrucomicrobiaceae bacterium E54]